MSGDSEIFDARSIPDEVGSSTKDPEIAEWLKTGPVLGAHEPVHAQRRAHDAFIDEVMPPIGEIEHLGLGARTEPSRFGSITRQRRGAPTVAR